MTFQCPLCNKKPFNEEAHLSNHIKRKHFKIIKEAIDKLAKDKKSIESFASKITILPQKIKIPSEYISSFTSDLLWNSRQ